VEEQTMNAKKYLVATVVLSTVIAAVAASVRHHRKCEIQFCATQPTASPLSGPIGKFGPVTETLLPDPKKPEGPTDILSMETGRTLAQPTIDDFNSDVEAIFAWPRSHGCDISCFLYPGGAACVTYGMTAIPVESKAWEHATEAELLSNPALAPVSHAPRRLLKLGQTQPDTYVFRTGKGTLGMLRLVGLSLRGRGVTIRYKLINAPKSLVASTRSQ
jgi:hypothetical protein